MANIRAFHGSEYPLGFKTKFEQALLPKVRLLYIVFGVVTEYVQGLGQSPRPPQTTNPPGVKTLRLAGLARQALRFRTPSLPPRGRNQPVVSLSSGAYRDTAWQQTTYSRVLLEYPSFIP